MSQSIKCLHQLIQLQDIESTREDFLNRVGCRLYLLPSGCELNTPIETPPGAFVCGKLLYGTASRYKLLGRKRRAGERTESFSDASTCWLQYGGPPRQYGARDAGPAGIVEFLLLPKGCTLESHVGDFSVRKRTLAPGLFVKRDHKTKLDGTGMPVLADTTTERAVQTDVAAIESTLKGKVGGLSDNIDRILRRVVAPTIEGPLVASNTLGAVSRQLSDLGLGPVRGVLLHGPPGCGKVGSIVAGHSTPLPFTMLVLILSLVGLYILLMRTKRRCLRVKLPEFCHRHLQRSWPHRNCWIDGSEGVKSWYGIFSWMLRRSYGSVGVTHPNRVCTSLVSDDLGGRMRQHPFSSFGTARHSLTGCL